MVGQGWVTPRDFWKMSPGEVWWTIRARIPKKAIQSRETNAELYRMLKEAKAKEKSA